MNGKTIRLMSVLIAAVLFCLYAAVPAMAKERKTWIDEKTVLVEYLDDDGNPVNGPRGYASVKNTYDEFTRLIREEHFGLDGEFWYGGTEYCRKDVLYEDGGSTKWIFWCDENGKIVPNEWGYSHKSCALDSKGRTTLERYFGPDGEPYRMSMHHYGIRYEEFDELNHSTRYTYVDQDANPIQTPIGYATVVRRYEGERVIVNRYYDLEGNPAKSDYGVFGDRREYDEAGRESLIVLLDENGNITQSAAGYSMIRKEYEDDRLARAWYLDKKGKTFISSQGQSGVRYVNKDGWLTTTPIDKNGQSLFSPDKFLMKHPELVCLCLVIILYVTAKLPERFRKMFFWAYILFILYMTLLSRENGEGNGVSFNLWKDIEKILITPGRLKHLMDNIVLFLPLGFVLYLQKPGLMAMIWPVLLSCGIEIIQLVGNLGFCELLDIIGNGLGGLIGAVLARLLNKRHKKQTGGS